MKISNFKIIDSNMNIINIDLGKEIDIKDLNKILQYLGSGCNPDFINLLDGIDKEVVHMVIDSITKEAKEDNDWDVDNIKTPVLERRNIINEETKEHEMNQEKEEEFKMEEVKMESVKSSFDNVIEELKNKGHRNIYISGPIRYLGYDVAKKSFRVFAKILENEGFTVDHTFTTMYPNNRKKEYYIKNGIIRMMQCSAVVRFNTQIVSEGASMEKDVANVIGMPYYEVDVACVIM